MSRQRTVVFDIIGTCFSLHKPQQKLIELGAPKSAISLWYAQTLRDAMALSTAGGYQPFKEILAAELPRVLAMLEVEATEDVRSQIMATFAELEIQPDALKAFKILQTAGWELVALSNGSEDSTRKLLEQSNALTFFSNILSCDIVKKIKPHPDVYALAKGDRDEIWMVAAHAWDIMGAALAGLKTAFITQEEKAYLSVYPQPDVMAINLIDAANQII